MQKTFERLLETVSWLLLKGRLLLQTLNTPAEVHNRSLETSNSAKYVLYGLAVVGKLERETGVGISDLLQVHSEGFGDGSIEVRHSDRGALHVFTRFVRGFSFDSLW